MVMISVVLLELPPAGSELCWLTRPFCMYITFLFIYNNLIIFFFFFFLKEGSSSQIMLKEKLGQKEPYCLPYHHFIVVYLSGSVKCTLLWPIIQSRLNKFFTLRAVRHWNSCPKKLWMCLKFFKDRLDEGLNNISWWKVPMAVVLELDIFKGAFQSKHSVIWYWKGGDLFSLENWGLSGDLLAL